MEIKKFKVSENYTFEDLVALMALLRGENGCPWDREQTHKSIRKNFIEEVYEAAEAIDKEDSPLLKEELGDVLLQVVFHAEIAREEGKFSVEDCINGICKKLVLRHPHIFGDVKADTAEAVLVNWDEIKKEEKGQKSQTQVLKSVSDALPSLMRSQKLQQKAAKVGFDWEDHKGAFLKLKEEIEELKEAADRGIFKDIEEEIGDMLFAMVNVARHLGIDAEGALEKTCKKFINRFSYIEKNANIVYNRQIDELTLAEMDKLWDEAKEIYRRIS
jgi:tetrapyrrole methylase family protein/MazG family protein